MAPYLYWLGDTDCLRRIRSTIGDIYFGHAIRIVMILLIRLRILLAGNKTMILPMMRLRTSPLILASGTYGLIISMT